MEVEKSWTQKPSLKPHTRIFWGEGEEKKERKKKG